MLEYKIVPKGSEKWLPRDWEKFYKRFQQRADEVPTLLGKILLKCMEWVRCIAATQYLTGPRPKKLAVDTGRLRASVNYRVTLVSNKRIEGVIGTDVKYGKFWEETVGSGRIYPTFRQRKFFWAKYYESGVLKWKYMALTKEPWAIRPFLFPSLGKAEPFFLSEFRKVGLKLQVM